MAKIPQLKKKLNSFLTKEDGKISKEKLIRTGVLLSAVALASLNSVAANGLTHTNAVEVSCDSGGAKGDHSNHSSHSHSHSSGDCCFPVDTMITTTLGKVAIQDIKRGDKVISYDIEKKETKKTTVLELESPEREGVYEINNDLIRITNEHPIYTKKKDGKEGWAAIDKEAVLKEYPHIGNIMTLEEGDFIFSKVSGWIEIKSIRYIEGKIQTYNLKKVEEYNNFFAEGLLVHNKGGPCSW